MALACWLARLPSKSSLLSAGSAPPRRLEASVAQPASVIYHAPRITHRRASASLLSQPQKQGLAGPPAEVHTWWWPERVSRMGARLRMPLEDSLASGRLSKPRRWLKLGGRADRGWGGTQTESDLSDRDTPFLTCT